ncbi:MAG: hypothetical protein AAGJ08_16380 [Cyanobacteria bacterium P01_H01_bin.35]
MYKIFCFYPLSGGSYSYPEQVAFADPLLRFERNYRPMIGDIFIFHLDNNPLGGNFETPFQGFEVEKIVIFTNEVFHCYGRIHNAIEDLTPLHIDKPGLYIGHTDEQIRAFPERYGLDFSKQSNDDE